jgi:hypothetical protein
MVEYLRAAWRGGAVGGSNGFRGDWEVTADMPPAAGRLLIPAAVLIAITAEPEPQLLLTKRTATMRRHPGQIAFPGGRIDPEDADAVAAATSRSSAPSTTMRRGRDFRSSRWWGWCRQGWC